MNKQTPRLVFVLLVAPALFAQASRDTDPQANVALHKPVVFLPAPAYAVTARGDTDATDLTDGKVSTRADQRIWYETTSVGWSYQGRVNLAVDLGQVQPIDEVAIRFQGGTPSAGLSFPLWVEVFTSDGPGEPYYRVAEFSRWSTGDLDKYEVPRSEGKAWVHRLRFKNLYTRGRFVGLRFYSTAYCVSDELFVFKGEHDPKAVRRDPAALSDFTVTQAEMHFHKPAVWVSSNIVTPLPIGMLAAAADTDKPMTIRMTLPPGIRVAGGFIAGVSAEKARTGESEYEWTFRSRGRIENKVFGRLYVTGAMKPGAVAELSYQLQWGDYTAPIQRVPVRNIEFPAPPVMPTRLTTSLSWWNAEATRDWPEWRQAFEQIGLNTVPGFTTWLNPADSSIIDFFAQARDAGYRVHAIDSTWHALLSRRAKESEIYCQFADGTHGAALCPSYRGPFYAEELERVATGVRLLKPNLLHCDIELWSGNGPTDSQKCTRCRADKEKSGISAWGDWQLRKGEELWTGLFNTVQKAASDAGGPPVEMGLYDARPGESYQKTWPFDRLYPKYMQTSQVSTYTSFEPFHIELTGNEARRDRLGLPKSDVFPWITPGDAGTFPGEEFFAAIMECFFNGARGVNFWSSRVWDAEGLAAYARAIRVAAQVEDIILDGELFVPDLDGGGRVSGMKRGGEFVLLVGDYWDDCGGVVRVKLNEERRLRVTDLETQEELAILEPGARTLNVPLRGLARALRFTAAP